MPRTARPEIMVAPNGARRLRTDHPALPVTPRQLAETAAACFEAGAGALHLHVRDVDGRHSLDPSIYRTAMKEVAATAPSMSIQITTEGAGRFGPADQLSCLRSLRPARASIAVREIARDPAVAPRVYALCRAEAIEVQHILYSETCIGQLRAWMQSGVVAPDQRHAIAVLGRYDPPTAARPGDLDLFLPHFEQLNLAWMACAFGPEEHACLRAAHSQGGALRVGFENSLTDAEGRVWRDNAQSVARLIESLDYNSRSSPAAA